jgi:MFS family permease
VPNLLDVYVVLCSACIAAAVWGLAGALKASQGGLCFGAVLVQRRPRVRAIGIYTHQLWLLWLGSGVIGGIGLGLGYISPVSTLIKWFPDRRGMATGMAIMGFGGGAMIGAPLANILIVISRHRPMSVFGKPSPWASSIRVHDDRSVCLPRAAGWLGSRWLEGAGEGQHDDHDQ